MKCSHCGRENPHGRSKCVYCGRSLSREKSGVKTPNKGSGAHRGAAPGAGNGRKRGSDSTDKALAAIILSLTAVLVLVCSVGVYRHTHSGGGGYKISGGGGGWGGSVNGSGGPGSGIGGGSAGAATETPTATATPSAGERTPEPGSSRAPVRTAVANDAKFFNSDGVYVTDGNYWMIDHISACRVDKESLTASTLTDRSSAAVGVTRDSLYYYEEGTDASRFYLYKISDGMSEPEYQFAISSAAYVFMDDEYLYSVSSNGKVVRNRNDKDAYADSETVLYTRDSGDGAQHIARNTQYINGYIYFNDEYTLVKVPVSGGEAETLTLRAEGADGVPEPYFANRLYYSEHKMVYNDNYGNLFMVDLDTFTINHINEIAGALRIYYFNGDFIVYCGDKYYDIDAVTGEVSSLTPTEELSDMLYTADALSDVGIGVVTYDGSYFELYDYDGSDPKRIMR